MLTIKYFGMMAEVARCDEERLALNETNFSNLISVLHEKYNIHNLPVQVAVNRKIRKQSENFRLKDNDEIAVLPPFSGG